MEIILNRWRGTGLIFSISKLGITGTMIYSLYFSLIFGLLTENTYVGLLTSCLFLLGESFGWGKWVGALCYPETKTNLQKEYDDLEGYNFPYIHKLANYFVKERKNFFNYCRLALFFRGLLWGLLIYLTLVIFNYISLFEYIFIVLIYGVGFPLACYLSNLKSFSYKNKFMSVVGKWESQEIYYGFIHFICNIYIFWRLV